MIENLELDHDELEGRVAELAAESRQPPWVVRAILIRGAAERGRRQTEWGGEDHNRS